MAPTEKEVEEAHRVLRADYFTDVRNIAEEFIKKWNAREFASREDAMDWLHETVDGSQRVIYTAQAADCLRYSEHDDAGLEEMGPDGFNFNDGFPWSQLAYFAFRADIMRQIECGVGDLDGVDVNDDPPEEAEAEEEDAEEGPSGEAS